MVELTTICFSHYNERARWALDRCEVPYVEHKYLPMFHWGPVWYLGRRYGFGKPDDVSSKLSTPVMVTRDGVSLNDSSLIVRYAAERCPAGGRAIVVDDPEVAALSQQVLSRLGPHSRRLAYHYLLMDAKNLADLARRNVGYAQALAFRLLSPAVGLLLRRVLKIDQQAADRSLAVCREQLGSFSELIGSRRYLVGDRFSDADLTFACMAAPLLVPSPREGYGATLPSLAELPADYAKLAAEFRATPAGRFALRMFAEER